MRVFLSNSTYVTVTFDTALLNDAEHTSSHSRNTLCPTQASYKPVFPFSSNSN